MSPVVVALGVLLVTSVAGNALLFDALGDARDRATREETGRRTAVGAAQTCSNYVGKLSRDAKNRAEAGKPLIEAAAASATEANRRADAEVARAPAVPGDACASAAAENRGWLQKRREANHGR